MWHLLYYFAENIIYVLFAFSPALLYVLVAGKLICLRMFRRGPCCTGQLCVLFSLHVLDSFFFMDNPHLCVCVCVCVCVSVCRLEYVS